jgi:hypothetical protein
MTKTARILMTVASLLLGVMYLVPLWRIDLVAPQYPEGLGMYIRINTVTGLKPNDLDNINGLNHYIGMRPIVSDAIPELRWMPIILGALIVAGLAVAAIGRRKLVLGWLGTFAALGAVGIWRFWAWGYEYGHNLDMEHAIIKVPGMAYQPPVIGSKQLLNFTATSWPDVGSAVAAISIALAIAAFVISRPRHGDVPVASAPRPSARRPEPATV